jgi:hypothetical protein
VLPSDTWCSAAAVVAVAVPERLYRSFAGLEAECCTCLVAVAIGERIAIARQDMTWVPNGARGLHADPDRDVAAPQHRDPKKYREAPHAVPCEAIQPHAHTLNVPHGCNTGDCCDQLYDASSEAQPFLSRVVNGKASGEENIATVVQGRLQHRASNEGQDAACMLD